jgi:hypothetical protein
MIRITNTSIKKNGYFNHESINHKVNKENTIEITVTIIIFMNKFDLDEYPILAGI